MYFKSLFSKISNWIYSKPEESVYKGKPEKHTIVYGTLYLILIGCFGYLVERYRAFYTILYANGKAFQKGMHEGVLKAVKAVGKDGTAVIQDSSLVHYKEVVIIPRGNTVWYYSEGGGKLLSSIDWGTVWHMSWVIWVLCITTFTLIKLKGYALKRGKLAKVRYFRDKEHGVERVIRQGVLTLVILTALLTFANYL